MYSYSAQADCNHANGYGQKLCLRESVIQQSDLKYNELEKDRSVTVLGKGPEVLKTTKGSDLLTPPLNYPFLPLLWNGELQHADLRRLIDLGCQNGRPSSPCVMSRYHGLLSWMNLQSRPNAQCPRLNRLHWRCHG